MSPEQDAAYNKATPDNRLMGACRELTVGEILDRRITDAEHLLKSLYSLKGALSGDFLNSSGSRISPLLKG